MKDLQKAVRGESVNALSYFFLCSRYTSDFCFSPIIRSGHAMLKNEPSMRSIHAYQRYYTSLELP